MDRALQSMHASCMSDEWTHWRHSTLVTNFYYVSLSRGSFTVRAKPFLESKNAWTITISRSCIFGVEHIGSSTKILHDPWIFPQQFFSQHRGVAKTGTWSAHGISSLFYGTGRQYHRTILWRITYVCKENIMIYFKYRRINLKVIQVTS